MRRKRWDSYKHTVVTLIQDRRIKLRLSLNWLVLAKGEWSLIRTVNELLIAIRDRGIKEIKSFLNIKHEPTIGDMYEGFTKTLAGKAVILRGKNGALQIDADADCGYIWGG